ncbi:MAG: FAD-binding protein [Armatimonadetes bacterium]|nr:FAD-binding protein [Armatimonadota bacterium]
MERLQNWAKNYTFSSSRLHRPETLAELRRVIAQSRNLRVLGSRHSFNGIADCTGELLSLEALPETVELDQERSRVTVGGGVTYARLCRELDAAGLALPNLASLPHLSVAGACATGTHGSGDRLANLATVVSALELVTAEGDVRTLTREADPDRFPGAVVSLGSLGVVYRLTLELVPAFWMQQEVYENVPLAEIEAGFDSLFSSAYSVSYFTTWQGGAAAIVGDCWVKRRLVEREALPVAGSCFGGVPAAAPRHPIAALSAECCTTQLGAAGPWHERLPHFRPDHLPSSSAELQSEYFVPRQQAVAALRSVAALGPALGELLQISEVRTVAQDDLWLSPCYERDSVGIHFTWKKDWPGVERLLPRIEEQLEPFQPRPHWGKLFTLTADRVRACYRKLPEFRSLRDSLDPAGKFRNAFVDRYGMVA